MGGGRGSGHVLSHQLGGGAGAQDSCGAGGQLGHHPFLLGQEAASVSRSELESTAAGTRLSVRVWPLSLRELGAPRENLRRPCPHTPDSVARGQCSRLGKPGQSASPVNVVRRTVPRLHSQSPSAAPFLLGATCAWGIQVEPLQLSRGPRSLPAGWGACAPARPQAQERWATAPPGNGQSVTQLAWLGTCHKTSVGVA